MPTPTTITRQGNSEGYSVVTVITDLGTFWTIPILARGQQPTSDYIQKLKKAIRSDKCTMAIDWNVPCCVLHDLVCSTGIDHYGQPTSRRDADTRFWRCNRDMVRANTPSRMKRWWGLLRADVRYAGVRIGAVT